MELSIIIVNWNSKDYLHRCIASILSSTISFNYEIIVIDNASFDGCQEMIKEFYPEVIFLQSDCNIGFAKANNLAAELAKGDRLLFLNPDTVIVESAIETLHRAYASLPDVGIVGARLVSHEGSVQNNCIQAFPTILNMFLDSELLRNRFPQAGLWGMKTIFEKTETPAQVDVVSGACLMISNSVYQRVGMFSTEYFMYSEDVDLCYKVRNLGFKTYYVPRAVVIHYGGASSSKSSLSVFSSVMMLESRCRYFLKTRQPYYSRLFRFAMFVMSIIRIIIAFIAWPICEIGGRGKLIRKILKKWIARLRWTLGGENWVRNY